MEQNPTILAKKLWSLVRVAYFMLRKGVSKRKLLLDLNMMVKRGKIAGKALQNLMSHHHHHHHNTTNHHLSFPSSPPPGEYEFSCSNSPAASNNPFSLFSVLHKKHHHSGSKPSEDLDMTAVNAVLQAMEMIQSENSSPALPGFGSTPMVRQLRVTDSPFPLNCVEEDNHVNEAAEDFISRFYKDLRLQNTKATSFGSS